MCVDEGFSKEYCLNLYREMKRIRFVEDEIADNYYNTIREMHTPVHLCNGQEAVAVGVCQLLEKADIVFSNHRCHGHYLAKGGNLNKMMAELFSKETGCCQGKGGSMHLVDKEAGVSIASSIVAGNVSIGTGYAMGLKQQGKKQIAVVFLGDGASEEGSVYESICFAKIHKLPVLFICENNLYAISTGLAIREPEVNISGKFKTIIDTEIIDGNDVLEVNNVVAPYVERARKGDGPAFIECLTYRMRDHHNIGTGIDSGYRTQKEWDEWEAKDPILRLERDLVKQKWIDSAEIQEMNNELQKEIKEAFRFAHDSKLPDVESLYEHLWRE